MMLRHYVAAVADGLAAAEAVAAVMTQIAVAASDGDRPAIVAARSIALKARKLATARFRFRTGLTTATGYHFTRITKSDETRLGIPVALRCELGTIAIDRHGCQLAFDLNQRS